MKRLILVLVVLALMMAVMAAPAGADGDNEVVGSWVAIDAEGSFWQMAVSASGRINSIDSGTFPCEGYRTHLWGELEAIAENLFTFSSLDLRCLAGPYKGTTFTGFGGLQEWVYDPVTDTLTSDNPDPLPDTTFCRRPCDPYDYYNVP
jgi:hypothetical protein